MWIKSESKLKHSIKGATSLFTIGIALASCGIAEEKTESEALAKVVDVAFAEFDTSSVPGCAIGVQKDGTTLLAKGYGLSDLATGVPITADTHFNVASVSKQFTVLAILQLQAEGKLSLDDLVSSYIPEISATESPITIRHLIHHTSGLMDYTNYLLLAGFGAEDGLGGFAGLTRNLAMDILTAGFPAAAPVGSEWSYNNGGYLALAEIVKRVSGEDFETYARKHVLEAVGMQNSYFRSPDEPDMGPVAKGYKLVGGKPVRGEESVSYSGDGGLITTLNDFLLYLGEMDKGETLWDADTRRFMTTPGRLVGPSPYPATGTLDTDYGGGLFIRSNHEKTVLLHGGYIEGYNARWRYYPEDRVAMAALCNSEATNSVFLVDTFNRIADHVFGPVKASGEQPATPQPARSEIAREPLSSELRSRFEGTYVSKDMKTTYSFKTNGPAWKISITSPYSNGTVTTDLPPFTITDNKIMLGLATLGFEIDREGTEPIDTFYLSADGFPKFKFIRVD